MREAAIKIGMGLAVLVLLAAATLVQYHCCRSAGFSHEICVYHIVCEE